MHIAYILRGKIHASNIILIRYWNTLTRNIHPASVQLLILPVEQQVLAHARKMGCFLGRFVMFSFSCNVVDSCRHRRHVLNAIYLNHSQFNALSSQVML